MKISLLIPIVFIAYSASAQINSGTLIVFQITKDKLVIAADSRSMTNGVPDDTSCKIMAFNDKIVFFTDGSAGYRPINPFDIAFDNRTEAANAIRSQVQRSSLEDIANAWAQNVIQRWQSLYALHPEVVVDASKIKKGELADGVFAEAVNGKIIIAARTIVFKPEDLIPIVAYPLSGDCTTGPCAVGITDVFSEYMAKPPTSRRAISENITKPGIDEIARAKRLIELSKLHSVQKDSIGGDIDVLELSNSGRIQWDARKDNCQKNQDVGWGKPAPGH